jgi:nitrogenase subunit NifH
LWGFAVPIRSEYADAVYIVTSGEYLSLYAANNILKGIYNFTDTKKELPGLFIMHGVILKKMHE